MTFMGPLRDLENTEVRRRERAERLAKPYGREISARSRRIASAIAILALVAILVLVAIGWLNVDALRPPPLP